MNLYIEAAEILDSDQKTSLKSIVFNSSKKRTSPPKRLYALVSETVKFQDILRDVVDRSGILKAERKLTYSIALLFAHDYLLTKQGISASSGALKDAFMRHKTRVSAEFSRARLKRGYSSLQKLVEAYNLTYAKGFGGNLDCKDLSRTGDETSASEVALPNPRWIRVNTLKITFQDVLRTETFKDFKPATSIVSLFQSPRDKLYFAMPELLPDIIAIHPSHKITSGPLYISGSIILQSASSCLPGLLLNPPPGAHAIDACAAPGNKTTHLAALMNGYGKITAVEKDKNRSEVLEAMTIKAGAGDIVRCLKSSDFMAIDPEDPKWSGVEYLLLDPSCSGSGILNRIDFSLERFPNTTEGNAAEKRSSKKSRKRKREQGHIETAPETPATALLADNEEHEGTLADSKARDRLSLLSAFQLSLILHAFRFPSAKRITYSTCSVHEEENEMVVAKALSSDVAETKGWTVESRDENILRSWQTRGNHDAFRQIQDRGNDEVSRIAGGCVRVGRGDGLGGGFFVVCFVLARDQHIQDAHAQVDSDALVPGDGIQGQENPIGTRVGQGDSQRPQRRRKKKKGKETQVSATKE